MDDIFDFEFYDSNNFFSSCFSLNVLPFYCSLIWLCNEMLMNLI